MYLYLLNEEEQIAFLDLCTEIIKNSGCPYEKQKKIINEFCYEWNTLYIHYDDMSNTEEPTEVFSKSQESIKKVALFEALSLAFSDNILEQSEHTVIYKFAKEIGLENIYEDLKKAAQEYAQVFNDIEEYINN